MPRAFSIYSAPAPPGRRLMPVVFLLLFCPVQRQPVRRRLLLLHAALLLAGSFALLLLRL